jgi:hypothetical protein
MKTLIKILIPAMLIITFYTACSKYDIASGTPACIEKKIKDFDKNSVCNDPNVKKYLFQSLNVYVFNQGTCGADLTSEVIDEDCNSLGFLGGIAGNTVINGDDFSTALFLEDVWVK